MDPRWLGTAAVVLLTALHAVGLRLSVWSQNILVIIKGLLVFGFLLVGLTAGSHQWPAWQPPHWSEGFPSAAFAGSLFYIAFAFSGWNAAAYAAGEFKEPKRQVPRAMLIGCGLVGAFYLLVNWVFVANLTPESARVVFQYESARITLGHLVTRDLLGQTGAALMSILMVAALVSAASAMTFIGPRVYAAMARDGYLPAILRGKENRPPAGAVLLQGALALVLVFAYPLQQVLKNVGAILVLFTALTAFSLFWVRFKRSDLDRPPLFSQLAAGIYVLSSVWMLYYGFKSSPSLLLWVGGAGGIAVLAYLATRARKN